MITKAIFFINEHLRHEIECYYDPEVLVDKVLHGVMPDNFGAWLGTSSFDAKIMGNLVIFIANDDKVIERYHVKISTREAQVLTRIGNGLTSKQIAHELGISDKTVQRHVANLKHKFKALNSANLIHNANIAGYYYGKPVDWGDNAP